MFGLSVPELFVILVIALIIFGPRKLPEMGKSLGKAIAQFKHASDEFKRSWEEEIEAEKRRPAESNSVTSPVTTELTPETPAPSIHSVPSERKREENWM